MGGWNDKDTAGHSGDSLGQVANAEHTARDDATAAGLFERGNDELNSTPFSRDDDSGKEATSFWDSIFG
jgi:hypothetical protein